MGALSAAGIALGFEALYRLQVVDAYRAELRAYNTRDDLRAAGSRTTVLFMGDSVTAGERSYPALVRAQRPGWRVINAAIPGSGILQANLVAKRRFARFEPEVFVYQVNVGNDLLNLRYPVSWRHLSTARNVYWTLAHRFRSLEYLNYRAGQIARGARYERSLRELESRGLTVEDVTDTSCRWRFEDFEPERYAPRVRTYLRAEPTLFEDQQEVSATRRPEYERLLAGLGRLLARCERPACRAYVLVVPHASEVLPGYREAMRSLGARFDRPPRADGTESGFVTGIRRYLAAEDRGDVAVLDATPSLRAVEGDGRHGFFLHDPHLNDCGQRALAGLVLASLGDD